MRAPAVIQKRCHWCSKFRPSFRLHSLASKQNVCDYCLDWHMAALNVLGGAVPQGCQGCDRTWAQLSDQILGDEVRMYVVPKDGIYQLLCAGCVKPYLPKRKDLYRGTKFGTETLKIAA